jgi:GMP synthase (glutamine-hydrolysing)
MLARDPAAIILSGGPSSVYAPGAPALDPSIFDAGVPILGICYGFQLMTQALGGTVAHTGIAENGRTKVGLIGSSVLFRSLPTEQLVWMTHGDSVTDAPAGFAVTATSAGSKVAAFERPDRDLYGLQWHPEVLHTEFGREVFDHFIHDIASIDPTWTAGNIIDDSVERIRAQVGAHQVICGLSGGVDSAVAAALVQRAVGEQLTCVFVDHGLLREGEDIQVERDFVAATGVNLHVEHAQDAFLSALRGVRDPEQKRKIIGREFINAFERAATEIVAAVGDGDPKKFLVQGTLYPDVVESGGGSGTAVIKSHHNVGGLPEDLAFELVEPLRALFKDEVREIGTELGLPSAIVQRHPFPGPGLGIRIIGSITKRRLALLRQADAIVTEELVRSGVDRDIWQCPVVLLANVRSVGVQGDGRTYGHPIVLRPVTSEDAMTADWARVDYDVLERISTRITNEVRGVNRVILDITSKPPGSIEWE